MFFCPPKHPNNHNTSPEHGGSKDQLLCVQGLDSGPQDIFQVWEREKNVVMLSLRRKNITVFFKWCILRFLSSTSWGFPIDFFRYCWCFGFCLTRKKESNTLEVLGVPSCHADQPQWGSGMRFLESANVHFDTGKPKMAHITHMKRDTFCKIVQFILNIPYPNW